MTQCEQREERRVRPSLKLSGVPNGTTLASFGWSFQPDIDRMRIFTLATGAFVLAHKNVLFVGPPGVGKTHLVRGVAARAIELGLSTGYCRLDELIHAITRDAEGAPTRLKDKKSMKVALLVIDEVGYQSLGQEASLFFRLISCRYERGSTIVTSNKAVSDWLEVLAGDAVRTAALLDRFLHKSHSFNIKGRSFRLQRQDS